MRRLRNLFLWAGLCCLLASMMAKAATPAATAPEAANALQLVEVQYAEHGNQALKMTIVRQAGATHLPILLNIHGGGWCGGGRDSRMNTMAHDRAMDGYLFVDVDYRLAPFQPYPAACDDLRAAVQWLVAHAAEYGGDPARIGTFGWSAGGHLAAWLALTSPIPIACAVSWSGDMDLRDPALLDTVTYPEHHANCLLAFLGVSIQDNPALYASLSPVTYFSPKSPHLLVIHGESDHVVPASQARLAQAAAERTGAPVEVVLIPGAGHLDPGPSDPGGQKLWSHIRAFLASNLHPGTQKLSRRLLQRTLFNSRACSHAAASKAMH